MKIQIRLVVAVLIAGVVGLNNVNADVITTLNFEAGQGVGYTTSESEFTDGGNDYFTITAPSGVGGTYSGHEGGNFFAAQDIDDGNRIAPEQSLFITGIDITNFTNLTVDLLVAEDEATNAAEDWDFDDFFNVYASIDGGSQELIFSVRADTLGGFNFAPRVDTDLDGVGDGTEITDTFANFSNAISGTGSSLDLEFRFRFNAGDEDIAIDNIIVQGVPEPAGFGMGLCAAILAMTCYRRRRAL